MIGGLQPCSFIDYPGLLSTVVFLQGCNLRCPYCHNPKLVKHGLHPFMTEQELLSLLNSRQGLIDAVVITGGEPTLHTGLPALIRAIRALGFKIKLDTNGTRPAVLERLLADGLLDYVAMDLKDEPGGYQEWLGMQESAELLWRSMEIIAASKVDHELRTTVMLPRHDASRLDCMAKAAASVKRWVLQPCRSGNTLAPEFWGESPSQEYLKKEAERLSALHKAACSYR